MRKTYSSRHVGLGIAFIAASMLMTEIVLTRLFSVIIGFHFAFLAISVALFGIGVSAIALHLVQHRIREESTNRVLLWGSIALGASLLIADLLFVLVTPTWKGGSALITMQPTTASYLLMVFVTASVPFLVGGFVIALAVTRFAYRIHSLYFFDLLGAGLGCLVVIPLLSLFGAPVALVFVAAVAALGGLAFCEKETRKTSPALFWIPVASLALFVLLGSLNPFHGIFQIRQAKGHNLKTMPVEFNRWNSFSMVTVLGPKKQRERRFQGWGLSRTYNGSFPEQKSLVIDMGAMTPLTRFDGDFSKVGHVLYDLSAFAYQVRPEETHTACVIGAGGGRDVLSALASGVKQVTAVEINPLIVDGVVKGAFREFVGDLYNLPNVTAHAEDGRSFMRSTDEKFDLIQISMIDTSAATAAGVYSLTEHSLYTVEAFHDYYDHLNPGGLLTVSSISAPAVDAGARLLNIAWQSLREIGGRPAESISMVSTPWLLRQNMTKHGAVMMRNIIVKKEPFTQGEIETMRATAERLEFEHSYYPGMDLAGALPIKTILEAKSLADLEQRIRNWPLDVRPTTDDRPFFFYQNHLRDAWSILGLSPRKVKRMGTGLPVLLRVGVIAGVLVLVFLLVPIVFSRAQLRSGRGSPAWDLSYVACLGLGFMFVEIGLIQRLTLYLGFPTATLAVVLFVLLVAGATGSRLFGKVSDRRKRWGLALAILSLVVLVTILWQLGPARALLEATQGWSLLSRAVVSVVLLLPMGALLGIPLPSGIQAISSRAETRIPWLWAINSATSVLGSVSATIISMHYGISSTLWAGIVLYSLALLLSLKVLDKETD